MSFHSFSSANPNPPLNHVTLLLSTPRILPKRKRAEWKSWLTSLSLPIQPLAFPQTRLPRSLPHADSVRTRRQTTRLPPTGSDWARWEESAVFGCACEEDWGDGVGGESEIDLGVDWTLYAGEGMFVPFMICTFWVLVMGRRGMRGVLMFGV